VSTTAHQSFLIRGARSEKSQHALSRAEAVGARQTFIAKAEALCQAISAL